MFNKAIKLATVLRTFAGQSKRRTFVILLRKIISQKHATWPAVYSNVMQISRRENAK
jgi:hypothetical protein